MSLHAPSLAFSLRFDGTIDSQDLIQDQWIVLQELEFRIVAYSDFYVQLAQVGNATGLNVRLGGAGGGVAGKETPTQWFDLAPGLYTVTLEVMADSNTSAAGTVTARVDVLAVPRAV